MTPTPPISFTEDGLDELERKARNWPMRFPAEKREPYSEELIGECAEAIHYLRRERTPPTSEEITIMKAALRYEQFGEAAELLERQSRRIAELLAEYEISHRKRGELEQELTEERAAVDGFVSQLADLNDALIAKTNRIAELQRALEVRAAQREHAKAMLDRAIAVLAAIHSVMSPEHIKLPDGRVFEFNNPTIEHEMLNALCERIRAIPDEIAALATAQPSEGS